MTTVPLHIVHVIDSLDPARGGPPAVVHPLAAAQVSHGNKVGIVTATTGLPPTIPGVQVHVITLRMPWAALLGFGYSASLSALVMGADLIHLHGVWDPLILAAARAARSAGIPYVIMPHGMLHPWSLAQRHWKKQIALALGVRHILHKAEVIHALNADEAAAIGRLGLRAPVRVIPNGLNLADADISVGKPAISGLEGRSYILFLGRLHFKKGLDHLADAFARLPSRHANVRLVVAGPDDGERSPFEQRLRKLRVADRVHFLGPLYGPDKWAVLAGAACFCLPSRQEGFSIAILEALACRVPVVISDTCYFPEVGEAGAGMVVPAEPEKLANALDTVLTDPARAAKMGAAGRQLVASRYTWDKVAEQCDQMYAAATAGKGLLS